VKKRDIERALDLSKRDKNAEKIDKDKDKREIEIKERENFIIYI